MSRLEIESAVSQLSEDELRKFASWFDTFRADQWDHQIETDIKAGRLEELGKKADQDFEAGRCKPL
ncbi:MAG: hypothetical protein RH917_13435 [Lacipirellulaceae bacterium]